MTADDCAEQARDIVAESAEPQAQEEDHDLEPEPEDELVHEEDVFGHFAAAVFDDHG